MRAYRIWIPAGIMSLIVLMAAGASDEQPKQSDRSAPNAAPAAREGTQPTRKEIKEALDRRGARQAMRAHTAASVRPALGLNAVPVVHAERNTTAPPPAAPAGADQPIRYNIPPLDQIPPAPMPDPSQGVVGAVAPANQFLIHDATTGVTRVIEKGQLGAVFAEPGRREGYPGVFAPEGSEPAGAVASFGNMTKINDTTSHPWRMNVKLVMRFVDQTNADRWFVCSGTMVDAETVQTAGHCVYARTADGPDIFDWAQEIFVYPGRNGSLNPFGVARGTWFGAGSGWVNNGSFDRDAGVVRVTRAVGMLTGWFGNAWGGSCSWIQSRNYHNASYPAEDCPLPGLHNGNDMYYWFGTFDSCPGNQLQIDTGGGHCFDTLWGGMSGSGAYYRDGSSRFVHAVASNSNRDDIGRYCKLWDAWGDFLNNDFIPGSRGTAFDLQALDVNAEPASIPAGDQLTLSNFLAVNPTNATGSGTFVYRTYLSTNDNISGSDRLLSTRQFNFSFGTMSSVRVNMLPDTIPVDVPPGNYWFGVILDGGTDGDPSNNDTDGWDAVPITVTAPRPANDDCANATEITSAPFSDSISTGTATSEPTDPLQTCSFLGANTNSNSVWYRFDPPCEGVVSVQLCGSDYDTVLSFYTGSCGSFTEIACDDDGCTAPANTVASKLISVPVARHQTIYIEVTDYGSPGGGHLDFHFDFTAERPANDLCPDAERIGVGSARLGQTCGAGDDRAPHCGTSVSAPGVWYRVPGTGHRMTASTCLPGTDYDTKINVYCADCTNMPCIAGNDDAIGAPPECFLGNAPLKSRVSWCSQYGVEYLIFVQGFNGATGDFQLEVTDDGVPCTGAVDCGGAEVGACCGMDGGLCQPGVCGDFSSCSSANPFCVCGVTTDGGGACMNGFVICQFATPCPNGDADCPAGSVCWAHSCCGGPVCAPLCDVATVSAEQIDAAAAENALTALGPAGEIAATAGISPSQCLETTESICLAGSGLYQGNLTQCANVDCPGACCVAGTCVGVMSQADCLTAGGRWFENKDCTEITCPQEGACCASQTCDQPFVCGQNHPTCDADFECLCAATTEGDTMCANGDVPCVDLVRCTTSADCPTGTRCLLDTCCNEPVCVPACGSVVVAAATAGDGGTMTVSGTPRPQGQLAAARSCFVLEASVCASFNGTFQGPGTTCADVICPGPLGACCVGGTCLGDKEETDCVANGGTWFRGETCASFTCPQPQACCVDGTCQDLEPARCREVGGQPQGSGTDCASTVCAAPEACCLPNGECTMAFPTECVRFGGISAGPQSRCLGDQDGNGVDDACQANTPCQDCGPGRHWVDGCPAGGDTAPSGALIGIDRDGDCQADASFVLNGPVRIRRSSPRDDSMNFPGLRPRDNHPDVLDTEIVSMTLSGGGLTLIGGGGQGRGGVLRPSLGAIAEQPADPALADSFFDVFVEVELAPGLFVYNHDPLRVESKIDCVPPQTRYLHPVGCVPLYDSPEPGTGRKIAWLVTADHTTYPACGDPEAGECLAPHPTPNCADATCCERVCSIEPGCCKNGWSQTCVSIAQDACVFLLEACCLPDGTCQMMEPLACQQAQGVPRGPGSDCASVRCPLPAEACCLPDGSCTELPPSQCQERGGAPQGAGTSCARTVCPLPPEACCLRDGTCVELTPTQCQERGGTSQGAGTTCANTTCPLPPEACCLPDGTCEMVPPDVCQQGLQGVPLGPGTRCQGDADGNGQDDACQADQPCDDCGPGPHWIHDPPCPAGIDRMTSGALIGIDLDLDCVADISTVLHGPVTVRRSNPLDDSVQFPGSASVDGHLDVIDTEIVALDLSNPAAGIFMRGGAAFPTASPLRPTLGAMVEQGPAPQLVDSFFDVFVEVESPMFFPPLLYNWDPIRVKSVIDCVPPIAGYLHPRGCIPLYDIPPVPGVPPPPPIANLVTARHDTFPTCGTPSAGDCFTPNGTPYCDDETCCGKVCEVMPFCCEVEWNDNCAGMAMEVCERPEACCMPEGRCLDTIPSLCRERGGTPLGPDTACEGDLDGNGQDDACQEDTPCDTCGPGDHWVDNCSGGADRMPSSALVGIDLNLDCQPDMSMVLRGPVTVWRSNPLDDSLQFPGSAPVDGHFDVIDTEIVALELSNPSSGVVLRAGEGTGMGPLPPSPGAILEQSASPPLADSFFDVMFEIDLGGGRLAYNHDPLRVKSKIDCLPPDAEYIHPTGCIPLFDVPVGDPTGGQIVANLVSADHSTFPTCGDPTTGDCFVPNGTPFCDDAACCGRVCETNPACCTNGWDERCASLAQDLCIPSEACCMPDATCQDLPRVRCIEAGGTPQGADTTCANTVCTLPPEACCFGGRCAMMPPDACQLEGGTPLGPDTRCRGDADGDGNDDACQQDTPCDDCGPGPHWIDNCFLGSDNMPTGALIGIDLDGDCQADRSMVLSGPVSIWRSGPRDDSANFPGLRPVDGHRDVIDTEIVAMSLTNPSAAVTLTAGAGLGVTGPLLPSLGAIAEQPDAPALADSFFDVFVELDLGGMPLRNMDPLHVQSKIDCVPPDTRYLHPVGCVPMFDPTGNAVVNLVTADHSTFPTCGDSSTGDCFAPNGTPFCDDAGCCRRVCSQMPFCCDVEWNDNCAGMALEVCGTCEPARIVASEPPTGTLDARQPHEPHAVLPLQGFGTPEEPIIVQLDPPVSFAESCFNLCEGPYVIPRLGISPNAIRQVTDLGGGRYEIILEHAITPGAVTSIIYKGSTTAVSAVRFIAHPANADQNTEAAPADVRFLMSCCLNDSCVTTPTRVQCDIDRSGASGPGDLLRVIDLLNGGGTYQPWMGTPRPDPGNCP